MSKFNFYPRPPRGGRRREPEYEYKVTDISIHALREEGDPVNIIQCRWIWISIHALREEGDFFVPNRLLWEH